MIRANNQTKLLVGVTGVNGFWGTSDQSFGLQISNGQLLLAVYRAKGANPGPATYALDASSTAAFAGFSDVSVSGSFDARLNTTGKAVDEPNIISGAPALHFDAGAGATASFTGTGLALQIGSFATVTGNFTFQKTDVLDSLGQQVTQTNFTVSATNVTAKVGVTDSTGFTGIELDGANFGLLFQKNLTAGTAAVYALGVSGGTASVTLPGLNLTATSFVLQGNTTGAAISNQTVGAVTLNFANGNRVFDVEGHVTGSIYNAGSNPPDPFVSVSADIGFQTATDTATGATEILAGATNARMVLGTSTTNVTVAGASFGLLVRKVAGAPATYALLSSGGSITFNGLPSDISFAVTNFAVEINNTGLDITTLVSASKSIHTSGGDVAMDFSALGASNVEAIQGTASMTIANSGISPAGLSFTGSFAFARADRSGQREHHSNSRGTEQCFGVHRDGGWDKLRIATLEWTARVGDLPG